MATPRAEGAITLSITTTSDTSDGNTSSITKLLQNPGADQAISLREALAAANNTPPGEQIILTVGLPDETDPRVIVHFPLPPMQRGNVQLDGALAGGGTLVLEASQASYNSPAVLTITSASNQIGNLTLLGYDNDGVMLTGNASENLLYDMVIENNGHSGITFDGANVTQNRLLGTTLRGNLYAGIELRNGTHDNQFGGTAAGEANAFVENEYYGVVLGGQGSKGNAFHGNTITSNGTGMLLFSGSQQTVVANNRVSGNEYAGIWLDTTTQNVLVGNLVGLAADGTTSQWNGIGVLLSTGADQNTVGSETPGEGNIISGNATEGLTIYGLNNTIAGNVIGLDVRGQAAVPNRSHGIRVAEGATQNTIEANTISGNVGDGIHVVAGHTLLRRNRVGLNAAGSALPNRNQGISVYGVGSEIGPGNIVASHASAGIFVDANDVSISDNTIENNRQGVCVTASAVAISNNIIRHNGGDQATASATGCSQESGGVIAEGADLLVSENTIHNNLGSGVTLLAGSGNRVLTNSITGNSEAGIVLLPGANNTIAAPQIKDVSAIVVRGTSCAYCQIQVFTDNGDQGQLFLGSTTANPQGAFALTIEQSQLTGSHVTATATDTSNNTSPFALPFAVSPLVSPYFERTYLPLLSFNR